MALSDFLGDLLERGGQELSNAAMASLHTNGTSAHIQYQNAAAQQLATILAAFNAGQITNADAQQRILATDQNFTRLAQQFGYARALQGARDIDANAQAVLIDLRNRAAGLTPPGGGGVVGLPGSLSAGLSSITSNPLAMIAIGYVGYRMFKGRF